MVHELVPKYSKITQMEVNVRIQTPLKVDKEWHRELLLMTNYTKIMFKSYNPMYRFQKNTGSPPIPWGKTIKSILILLYICSGLIGENASEKENL